MNQKLLIIDGHSLAYRGYHAVKNSESGLLVDPDGTPVTMTKTFLRSLSKLVKKHQPTHLACCFDPGGKTWRHELYPEYKGNRVKDEAEQAEIKIDLRNLQAILKEKKIAVCVVPNYEADDTIASIVNQVIGRRMERENMDVFDYSGLEVIIHSADKDLLQLVDDDVLVSVHHQQGKNSRIYTDTEVLEEYGVHSHQISGYKALVGDKSDNIPGVKRIGKVTALILLKEYCYIEDFVNDLDTIDPKIAKIIEPQVEQMLLYNKLCYLQAQIGVEYSLEQFANVDLNVESAIAVELGVA